MPRALIERAAKAGAIAGVVLVYLWFVGLVAKFDVRNIVGTLTLGQLMLVLPPLAAAMVVSRPRVVGGEWTAAAPKEALTLGAVAGAATGGVAALAIAMIHGFGQESVRAIFIAVSPDLLDIVEFGRGPGVASVVWIIGSAAAGVGGGAIRLIPKDIARPIAIGLLAVLMLGLLQRIVPPAMGELGLSSAWLYDRITRGLTVFGGLLTFAIAAGITRVGRSRRDDVRRRFDALGPAAQRGTRLVGGVALIALLLVMPLLLGSVITNTLGTVGIFLLMGLGLNIVVGYAGLLDLGYVAFFAVGAYFTALFTGARVVSALGEQTQAVVIELNFWSALPLVIIVAVVVGLLIGGPVLRLRGDYLAIVTLGFGEIARVLATSRWLQSLFGGVQGLQGIPEAPGFARQPTPMYYLILGFVLVAVFISYRLADSRVGRAWNAMREDEQVAEAMGVSTTRYKLLAFAMGAGIGCLSGALFAIRIGSLSPLSFQILVSIIALAVIILGGIGSIKGVIVGALVLVGLPELLSEFEEFRLLIYGAVLVGIMILRPQGLIPNVRRGRELIEDERAQDQWLKKSGVTVSGDDDEDGEVS